MAENNNIPNINNNQPNGANSANRTPQGGQNFGPRPVVPNSQNNIQPRPNLAGRSVGGMPPRSFENIPRVGQRSANVDQSGAPNIPDRLRLSSSQKFERSSKSLSHMNGGSSGAKLYRIDRSNLEDSTRRKVGGVVMDVDLIHDANKQKLENGKSTQKTVTIVVLSILLALSLVYLAIAIAGFSNRGRDANCKYYIDSEVSAHWLIDNNTVTEFLVREGLESGKVYEVESILVIDSDDKVNIKLTISATLNGEEIFISGLYEAADNLVRVDGKNTWVYVGGHQGKGEVFMFKGIDFFGAPETINSDNINITVHAEITGA